MSEPTGFILVENFEGSGYENAGWVENLMGSGTVNEDWTTNPLRGSQSLMLQQLSDSGNPNVKSPTGIGQTHAYGFFRYRCVVQNQNTGAAFAGYDSSNNLLWRMANSNGTFQLNSGTGESYGGGWTEDTTYFIWWEYSSGSAMRIWRATTGTKPGSVHSEITSGVATGTLDYISFSTNYINNANVYVLFDQVYVDDAAIGDVTGYDYPNLIITPLSCERAVQ